MTIGQLPDGSRHIRLADNIREEKRTDERLDGAEGAEAAEAGTAAAASEQTVYVYDEVEFDLDAERTDSEKDIKKDFAQWWEYGSQDAEEEPTLEERIAAIEDYLMEM